MSEKRTSYARLVHQIDTILVQYRRNAANKLQRLMEEAYFDIGKRILRWERSMPKASERQDSFLKQLAEDLKGKSGGGLSYETLKKLKKFAAYK